MIIEMTKENQFPDVRDFYYAVIDGIGDSDDSVGWKKDIYPAPEFLNDSIHKGELFTAVEDETIIGAMVMNHKFNDEYKSYPWPTIGSLLVIVAGFAVCSMALGFFKTTWEHRKETKEAQKQKLSEQEEAEKTSKAKKQKKQENNTPR